MQQMIIQLNHDDSNYYSSTETRPTLTSTDGRRKVLPLCLSTIF